MNVRRPRWPALALLLVASAPPVARAAPPARPAPLTVRILEPTAGIVDGDVMVPLLAEVSDPTLRTAVLLVNGASYPIPVEGGRIEQNVVATPGANRIGLTAERGGESARDSVTFFFRGDGAELVVLLGWPSKGEIIDLWVREPGGETCKWDHRETASGGHLADFSADAIGFGSQAYLLPRARAGRFRVKVHYWSAEAGDENRSSWDYRELIQQLDEDTGDRATLKRRLDEWASPAPPQTAVHAEAVLFPGTPHERRWRFDLVVQRTGQLVALGEVEITDEMIRAARAGDR